MDITRELLLNKGFTEDKVVWYEECPDYVYTKEVPLFNSSNHYYISITTYSNTTNRDWSVHIDNEVHSTSGKCDIQTVEQFNLFMQLLDINFKL